MNDKKIKNHILRQVLSWGLGGTLMIIGAIAMIFNNKLELIWPEYIAIGSSIMILGIVVWMTTQIIDYKKQKNRNEK